MLEPILILLLWAALLRIIRVDLDGTDLNQPDLERKIMTTPTPTFTREQLPRYLASLGDDQVQGAVIYKMLGGDVWYVEAAFPEQNRCDDLEDEFGWGWFYLDPSPIANQ